MWPRLSLLLMLAAAAPATDPAPFFQPGKLRALILSGRNNHDWRTTTPQLRRILEESGRFDVRVTEEPAGLTAETLVPYNLLVLDYNGPRWGAVAERAVESFVRSGKGMIALHAASYSFGDAVILGDNHVRTGLREPPWPEYARMIGATWSEQEPRSGHGDRHVFQVKWVNRVHPVSAGAEETFAISDELYHNLRLQQGIRVLATAFDAPDKRGTGKHEPVAWTVDYGKGRVFYTTLGHDVAALTAPGFVRMWRRAAEWAALGKVDPAVEEAAAAIRVTVVTGGHDYEPSFDGLFDDTRAFRTRVDPHPVAYRGDLRRNTDVLVLYDMVQDVPEERRTNLRNFVESGKGVVILHHALANFQKWEWWWRDVAAGRYLLEPDGGRPGSTYQHDVWLQAQPVLDHPITRGVPPMFIEDETYKGMWISPDVTVLLRTGHPTSDGPLAWISPYGKSRVVVIQLGHGSAAHRHPAYRRLVHNAIRWAAGKE
jgi:type 1 glutamine amidotransferase